MEIKMKNIIRDYFYTYRISRLKGGERAVLPLLAYFIAMPVFTGVSVNVNFRWEYVAVSTGILLPMGLSLLDMIIRSPGLDKILYLCPMSREERKKYIYSLYGFGVGIRMLFSLTGLGVIMLFFHCDAFSAIQILLNDFLMAILISSGGSRENGLWSKEQLLQIWIIALSLISNIIETGVVADEMTDMDIIVKLVLLGIFIIIQLPMAVKHGKYVKQELDDAVYYEAWQRRTA